MVEDKATDSAAQVGNDLSPAERRRVKSVTDRLKQLRRESGLRLTDVAAMSGLSEAYLSRVEAGARSPSLSSLFALAATYGIDAATLLEDSEPPTAVASHVGYATWLGGETGSGRMSNRSVSFEFDNTSRLSPTEDRPAAPGQTPGTPEELLGMALAGSFSMALAQRLHGVGFEPRRIETAAEVTLSRSSGEHAVTSILLKCVASVAGILDPQFQQIARVAKQSCLMSRALKTMSIELEARLDSSLVDEDVTTG